MANRNTNNGGGMSRSQSGRATNTQTDDMNQTEMDQRQPTGSRGGQATRREEDMPMGSGNTGAMDDSNMDEGMMNEGMMDDDEEEMF